jgi:hypothetical protein
LSKISLEHIDAEESGFTRIGVERVQAAMGTRWAK